VERDYSMDPAVRFGKPCLAGTRIDVATVVGALASGDDVETVADGAWTGSPRSTDRAPACVAKVDDVDGVLRVENLVVEVIPAPPEEQATDITKERARRPTASLGNVLDQLQRPIDLVRKQAPGGWPVAAPPQECGFDL
jgi:hypothetical protein